ncbi:MAG: DUF3127 domain-containing protein [Weeksellaceae bacterium]|nr:DUF3127 domain-containing protein [Weeksellaceae bacterium]
MEISGKVKKIMDEQTFSSGFKKRELIVQTQEQYPQPISIEFLQEKADLLNDLQEGQDVKVSIDIRGREWTSPEGVVKYFNSIVGWRVEKMVPVQAGTAPANQAPDFQKSTATPNPASLQADENDLDDDLPF